MVAILRKPTFDGITKDVNRLVTKLERLADHHEVERNAKKAEAEKLSADVTNHDFEAQRARATAKNFANLLTFPA